MASKCLICSPKGSPFSMLRRLVLKFCVKLRIKSLRLMSNTSRLETCTKNKESLINFWKNTKKITWFCMDTTRINIYNHAKTNFSNSFTTTVTTFQRFVSALPQPVSAQSSPPLLSVSWTLFWFLLWLMIIIFSPVSQVKFWTELCTVWFWTITNTKSG